MKISHESDAPADIVREPGARQVTIRRLIDTTDGADRFLMSLFELGSDAATPPHYHDWEHEIYVLSGQLFVEVPRNGTENSDKIPLKQGDVVFIPRGEPHGLSTGPGDGARLLLVAPVERPPIRSVFLSDEPYQFEGPASEDLVR